MMCFSVFIKNILFSTNWNQGSYNTTINKVQL